MNSPNIQNRITEAIEIIRVLGLPKSQRNDRPTLCLLALLNLTSEKSWKQSENPLMGITPIMDWIYNHYDKKYAPNTRETFRRQTMHQFVEAGLVCYNPDDSSRPVNSPKTVYQIENTILKLIKSYGTRRWDKNLKSYLVNNKTLASRYAMEREQHKIPIKITDGNEILLSSGEHNELVKKIIEEFGERFAPGGNLIYVGDTENKWAYFNNELLAELGVKLDSHGKMPDVVMYYSKMNWLFLIESVTSHGPVDSKRHYELSKLFKNSKAGIVYITAFPNRSIMSRFLGEIAWETEVWVADNPSHLIHFNGVKFLGPYCQ